MIDARQYVRNFIPANYFITKSMELSRVQSSGTLWFTKKFLVYYYYIFLSDNILYHADAIEICRIFDDYIATLPENIQDDAKSFFYSSFDQANPQKENFKLFREFAGQRHFDSPRDEKQYYSLAKKYYFAFLMETGGQAGVKAAIREKLYTEEFCFSDVEDIIRDYYGDAEFNMVQVINDYMASLRNERQILYYYGFFHSKSNGATDEEFSSLTPIGELALKSNAYEFIAIWEHQKFKMLSQPVSVQLESGYLLGKDYNYNAFAVNRHPYLTILSWLDKRGSFSMEEYQYIISRLHSPIDDIDDIRALSGVYDEAYNRVLSFHRRSETATEDFRKELLKYILGIRSDMPLDKQTNPLSLCTFGRSGIVADDRDMLKVVTHLYKYLSEYKDLKYGSLFDKCEAEMRRQYKLYEEGQEYSVDGKVKIEWDLYNMHIDIPTILTTAMIVAIYTKSLGVTDEYQSRIADEMYRLMPNIMKHCGFTTKSSRLKEVARLFNAFKNRDFSAYLSTEEENYAVRSERFLQTSSADLFAKLKEASNEVSLYREGKRERNIALITTLRAYNNKVFTRDGVLHCECCGNTTFITAGNETYMEYHHLIPFSSYEGPDHYLNLYALCPLCHRKMHYLPVADKRELYENLSENNYLHMSFEERLIDLKHERRLRSYHLEFLLADNAISTEQYNNIIAA